MDQEIVQNGGTRIEYRPPPPANADQALPPELAPLDIPPPPANPQTGGGAAVGLFEPEQKTMEYVPLPNYNKRRRPQRKRKSHDDDGGGVEDLTQHHRRKGRRHREDSGSVSLASSSTSASSMRSSYDGSWSEDGSAESRDRRSDCGGDGKDDDDEEYTGPCDLCPNGGSEHFNDNMQSELDWIMALERTCTDDMTDDEIWEMMLEERRRRIERPLRLQRKPYVPWSVPMIRAHFTENTVGHKFNPRRVYKQLSCDLVAQIDVMKQEGLVIQDVNTKQKSIDRRNGDMFLKYVTKLESVMAKYQDARLEEDLTAQVRVAEGVIAGSNRVARAKKRKQYAPSGAASMLRVGHYKFSNGTVQGAGQ